MLTQSEIAGFQKIYKKKFGVVLSHEEAREKGELVLRTMSLVYQPITEGDVGKIRERDAKREGV